ncbi:MAG: pseudouridine synthase [Parashewanella sp.]
MQTVRAAQASNILIPKNTSTQVTVLDFLSQQFPHIEHKLWQQRLEAGKVHWQCGEPIFPETLCRPIQRVYYYREVAQETKVPFEEEILFENENILIAHKPHFLPVTPSGSYVNECLINRLRIKTGIATITPAHRLDRDTAGIILMTKKPEIRSIYHNLFKDRRIKKRYQAIAKIPKELQSKFNQSAKIVWTVKNKLVRSTPSFLMKTTAGEANTHSEIQLIDVKNGRGLFELEPVTGKTHQLRVHMLSIGLPILNDPFYPVLPLAQKSNFSLPLKLLAKQLEFIDPISNKLISISTQGLDW